MTTVVVVGYGSIGARHASLLAAEECRVVIVSRRDVTADHPCFNVLEEAVQSENPDYVIVANETAMHQPTLERLAQSGFEGRVLVEKPLFVNPALPPEHRFSFGAVGYNLRFHPVLAALRNSIAGERIVAIQAYCGQFLPDWRPDRDWRTSYSADYSRGGGVLRDLSHELDYLLWLFGGWTRVAARGGNTGGLGIDADDCYGILIEFEDGALATVQINYLDRPGGRVLVVNSASHTWRADLIRNVLEHNGSAEAFAVERDDSYRAMHRAMLSGDGGSLCTFDEGIRVMDLIAAIEEANRTERWVAAA